MGYVGKVTAGGATHLVGSTLFGTCSTAAGTAQKTVSLSDFDYLETGVTVHVKFTNSNTAANATLKVGSTDAKPLCSNGTTRVGISESTSWKAGAVVSLTYDGTSWVMNDYIPDNDSDIYVAQNPSDTNSDYPLLMSEATMSGAAGQIVIGQSYYGWKSGAANIYANPSTGNIQATKFNGYTLAAACAKSVDSSISSGSTSANLPTSEAVAAFVASQITGQASFQGSLGSSTSTADYTQATLEASSYVKGWYWVVNAAGTYVGKTCGVGDMVYATSDKGSGYSASDFTVVQNEMDSISNAEIDTICV